jgi:hypothetical protein
MAKDIYHEQVKNALINEGWTITHDPFKIMLGKRRGYIVFSSSNWLLQTFF